MITILQRGIRWIRSGPMSLEHDDALHKYDGCSLPWLFALVALWEWLVGDWTGGILDSVEGFPSLFMLVLMGSLRWPRKLMSKPQNQPTTPLQ